MSYYRFLSSRKIVAFIALFVSLLLVCACGDKKSQLKELDLGGDFTLVDHNGQPFTLSAFQKEHPGDPVLLFFGFTHCPDACPQTLSRLSRATELLGPQKERVLTLLVSVDPERDSPAALKQYLANFPLRALGLYGSREEVTKIAALYAVNFYKNNAPVIDHSAHGEHGSRAAAGEDAEVGLINHSTQTFLIDGRGRVRYLFGLTDSVKEIADTIRLLL